MLERYADRLPLIDGAVDAVLRLAESFRLALASSSNRRVIDAVLEAAGLASSFEATVSSEEVGRGKPAPDVFLEAARRLDLTPERCAAVEDSGNGIRAAHAAGMRVVAIPNRALPAARRMRSRWPTSSSRRSASSRPDVARMTKGPQLGALRNVRCSSCRRRATSCSMLPR